MTIYAVEAFEVARKTALEQLLQWKLMFVPERETASWIVGHVSVNSVEG